MSTTPAPSRTDPAAVRAVLDVDRGHVVRAVAIAAALAFVIFAIPTFVGADWIGIRSLEHREPGTREKAAGFKAAII